MSNKNTEGESKVNITLCHVKETVVVSVKLDVLYKLKFFICFILFILFIKPKPAVNH